MSQAREIAKREHDAEVLADIKRVEARNAAEDGDLDATREAFDAALRLAPADAPPAVRADLLAEYAAILEALGDVSGASTQWKAAALAQIPAAGETATIRRPNRERAG